jgi:hypothetical protein
MHIEVDGVIFAFDSGIAFDTAAERMRYLSTTVSNIVPLASRERGLRKQNEAVIARVVARLVCCNH